MTSFSARADVPTDAPERYAKQLVAHLGRRLEWATDGGTSTARVGEGTGQVAVGDGVLTLLAEAPTPRASPGCRTCSAGTSSGSASATSWW